MIHARPFCLECEHVIERDDEVVFASPFDDQRQISAPFHGICLMTWREKLEDRRAAIRRAHEAFMRHWTGECGCGSGD